MNLSRTMLWTSLVVAGLALQAPAVVGGQETGGFVRTQPENMKFVDVEGGLGAQQAILEGDPAKPGLYVIQDEVSPRRHEPAAHAFPGSTRGRAEGHMVDGHRCPDFKPETTVPVKTGGYMKHPKDGVHYDGAKDEEVIVQIIGMGPVTSPRIRPAEGGYGYSIKK